VTRRRSMGQCTSRMLGTRTGSNPARSGRSSSGHDLLLFERRRAASQIAAFGSKTENDLYLQSAEPITRTREASVGRC
jgi:hypothetical protein